MPRQIDRHRGVLRVEVCELAMPRVRIRAGAVQEEQQLAALESRRHVGQC